MSPESPAPSSSSRLVSLQVFRAIAALWVLLCHVQTIAGLRLGTPVESPFMLAGSEAVSFFFVLSGFIITWVHWKHLGDPGNVRPYLARRFSRIYPLVIVVVAIKLIFFQVPGAAAEAKSLTPYAIAASFLLLPSSAYVVDVIWTLAFEILFYAVFALAVAFGRRAAVTGAVVWSVVLVYCRTMGIGGDSSTFTGMITNSSCLLFIMGGLSARVCVHAKFRSRIKLLWLPGLALTAYCIWFLPTMEFSSANPNLNGLAKTICWGVASVCIIVSMVSVELQRELRWPRWLQTLGDASYSIYLIHTSIMMFIVMLVKRSGVNFASQITLTLTVVGLVSLVGSVCFWKWVEVPLMAWWNRRVRPFLAGNRKLVTVPEASAAASGDAPVSRAGREASAD